ncbi:MAG: non-hydrolyzing UDP-N-acetylglucosamine 2-epimerase [Ilumatobacteraceae bacterium]
MSAELEASSVAVVLGTRPEVVKLAGVIRLLGGAARVVHTGQHFDPNLSDVFFDDLGLSGPTAQLAVGGATRSAQIGQAIVGLDELFTARRPQAVVVQGDTNAVLAASMAANALDIPLVHVEAGLRSFDRRMPEEHNRVVADHLADLCLAPTEVNRSNLEAEGITGQRVVVTGNTVVEAVEELLPSAEARKAVLDEHGLARGEFVLATIHRPENVDDPETLAAVLDQLASLPLPVVFSIHPRTGRRVSDFGLSDRLAPLTVIPPVGYPVFLALLAESAFAVSDSGGVQEEVSVLKRGVIVIRRSTERPEVVGTFAELALPGPELGELGRRWSADVAGLHARLADVPCPYGDGGASRRSVDALRRLLAE